MSVGKKPAAPSRQQQEEGEGAAGAEENGRGGAGAMVEEEEKTNGRGGGERKKEAHYERCFSGLELTVRGPLRDVDAGKLKDQIRRWARAVVAYARQLSFGSPRSRSNAGAGRSSSSRRRATERSTTFPSKLALSGDGDEPQRPP